MRPGLLVVLSLWVLSPAGLAQPRAQHNLAFDSLAKRWDEAMPLGNGWLGALIWQKNGRLRLSIDRVDLWDDRPMPDIDRLRFDWIRKQVKEGNYDTVQRLGDEPYEKYPAPTKIPGAAIEFDIQQLGQVVSNVLDISNGLSIIKFADGTVLNNYIHATHNVGYFGFEGKSTIEPRLVIPNYNTGRTGSVGNSVEGLGLEKLGYAKGTITTTANSIRYHQPTWNGHYYEVLVKWYRLTPGRMIGQWTISNDRPAALAEPDFSRKEPTGWPGHIAWWKGYWSRSSVSLPDTQLEQQYYREMYKFACVARSNTPPISLQAIWTADNGNLPPWKGDFHHDLNTQLSYWPGYAANHTDLTASYTNWLWKVREENRAWTKRYTGIDGLNVPGVTTISGKAMGGWVQYSMSPTTAAWVAQHFYWQWLYTKDAAFKEKRLLPYFASINRFIAGSLVRDPHTRKLTLPLSSSPEIHDNSINAWFQTITNYDLSLLLNFDRMYAAILPPAAASLARRDYPALDQNETGLTVARGENLERTHRHHSPYMAIYPLQLLNSDRRGDDSLVARSLRHIEEKGTREWCGYSFSWMACLYARARQAENAVKQLTIFASNFCSPNSFHLNGDQKGGQYSDFTYRPFTLEGNFAFAQGVHELLLQTRDGVLEIFPATPPAWKNVSFATLRAEGAFLVTAARSNGVVDQVRITAEQGGLLRIRPPFRTFFLTDAAKQFKADQGVVEIQMRKGETVVLRNGYE